MMQSNPEKHLTSCTDVERAAVLIRIGRTVAFPTETVYGLGADALNPQAVARIFEIKRRPRFDPLIVHVESVAGAEALAAGWPDRANELAERFWPGPLTLVLPKALVVPDIVTAGLPTVAVRVPDHPIAQELLRLADTPIAAPSANRFGSVSPTTAEHVRASLAGEIDFILDGGPCRAGVESTILSLVGERPTLLRPGAAPIEEIERLVGPVRLADDDERVPEAPEAPEAPGMLARHYATRKPLVLVDADGEASIVDAIAQRSNRPFGVLCLGSQRDGAALAREAGAIIEYLAGADDLREAAANLFAAMRRLDDNASIDWILAFRVPEQGLGRAINDRLKRASHERD